MTTLEKEQLKVKLTEKISEYLQENTIEENNIGFIPENLESLMSDAAFAVLMSVNATNKFLEEQDLLK